MKYKLRLNPKKCIFGVESVKVLGFVVSCEGIRVDPDKAKAIIEMPPPGTEKEVRRFLRKIQCISHFIAKLTTICEPIFKLLRKNQPTKWTNSCQKAFDRIKAYLANPPVPKPAKPDKPLLLYLSIENTNIGAMLAQEDDDGKEYAIYYLSRKLQDTET